MQYAILLSLLACLSQSQAANTGSCDTDIVHRLIQSLQSLQKDMKQCGMISKSKNSSTHLQGHQGSDVTEQRVQQMIDENLQQQIGYGELCYMGVKSRLIPDFAITASSFWESHVHLQYAPYRGRLDNKKTVGDYGVWAAGAKAVGQWIQVDFGTVKKVAGVITQGRSVERNEWVKTFTVSCGEDWNLAVVQENGHHKVFHGNSDMDTKVYNRFPEVLSCRFIRIYPQTWNNHISMRVEFVPGACFDQMPPFHSKSRNA